MESKKINIKGCNKCIFFKEVNIGGECFNNNTPVSRMAKTAIETFVCIYFKEKEIEFEHRPLELEKELCKKYYEKLYNKEEKFMRYTKLCRYHNTYAYDMTSNIWEEHFDKLRGLK